jgi:putative FmdB family regulatory protein
LPTYEYECEACGYKFERFQSIKAEPIKKCPECGKNKVKRLIGIGAGMIFKGSGFYITDYRDKSYNDKAKAESGGGSSGEAKPAEASATGSTESKSESKPALPAKSETKSNAKAEKPSKSEKKK